jgi:hypothetical protein
MARLLHRTVNGNLLYQNNAASVEIGLPAPFPGNVIAGNLQVQNNSASTQISNNTVGGNLLDQYNAAATVINGNTVRNSLEVQCNIVSTQVFNNSVSNTLQCQNDTSITGGGNTAGKKEGRPISAEPCSSSAWTHQLNQWAVLKRHVERSQTNVARRDFLRVDNLPAVVA